MKKREYLTTETGTIGHYQTDTLKGAYIGWKNSDNYELWHVYGSYSSAKINAFNYCERLMNDLKGWGLRIISSNIMQFTVGFEFEHPETGELCFAYITRDYNRFMKVEKV